MKTGRPRIGNPKKKYTISLDPAVKKEAVEILRDQGFSLSGAVELFLRSVISEKGFRVSFESKDPSIICSVVKMSPTVDSDDAN